jgi:hypothetical protein
MSDDILTVNDLIDFYNGHQGIAERANASQLRYIHVQTDLDVKILDWLKKGEDIILTGNPGDGKTHLLMFLKLPTNVETETDASQKTPDEILKTWQKCRRNKHQFVLAINHAPLRNLAQVSATDPTLKILHEMVFPPKRNLSAIDNFVIYSEEQENTLLNHHQAAPKIKIVDLSQREIISNETIASLLNNVCPLAAKASCSPGMKEQCGRCPLHDNAKALAHPQVQKNLVFILTLVARRGFHTTMRDLVGLLAYVLTGGVTCEELWRKSKLGDLPNYNDYDYYNLLFQGRSLLFDSLRQTFDPGRYSDPEIDLGLWSGNVNRKWLIPRTVGDNLALSSLDDLRSMKRRYFFEYDEPIEEKYRRMMTSVGQEFDQLLNNTDSESAVQDLVEMINLFYAPLPKKSDSRNYRDRLHLWNQHRYSIGQPPGYIAMRSLGIGSLQVYRPRLNPIYDEAIIVRQDHVLLAVQNWLPGDPALRIDWEMYKALSEAKQGKAIEVQPYAILRRLDLFLRDLGPTAGNWASIENIHWGDYKRRTVVSIKVNRNKQTYQE